MSATTSADGPQDVGQAGIDLAADHGAGLQ